MNQRGTTWGFTMNMLIVLSFFLPFFVLLVADYMQIGNIKQSIDNEFKRAVSEAIIFYVDDNSSSDRIAEIDHLEQDHMKQMIEDTLQHELQRKYHIDATFTDIDLVITDKIYVRYKGSVKYVPIISKMNQSHIEFQIGVKGRSKMQRFD